MEKTYRNGVILSLTLALGLGAFTPALFVFLADPCHIFHKPFKSFLTHGFNPIVRCQYAGLINSYLSDPKENFDSIIIGSSLSENFKPEYIPEKTPLKRTMKLSMVGTMPVEQNIIAEKSIATGNTKHIYWEILPYMYRTAEKHNHQSIQNWERLPAYLYNIGRLDDYRYIFNQSALSTSIDILLGETSYYTNSIDRIGYWENTCASNGACNHFYSAEDIADIQKSYAPVQRYFKDATETEKFDYSYFDLYVFGIIDNYCNKHINFDLFFPPISLLSYSQLNESDFDYEMYMLRHVVKKTTACSNVRVFSFMNEKWITADLSNYHDPKHFYGNIHDFMIDAMAEDKNRVTLENIEAFEKEMIQNVNEYRPYGTKLYPH